MKRLKDVRKIVLLILVAALTSSGLTGSAAQTGAHTTTRNVAVIAANPQRPMQTTTHTAAKDIQVKARPPIPFQPFPMVDPATGKQVPPDYVLTLPDGTKIKAGVYYSQLNNIEKELSKAGYSLRTMPDGVTIPGIVISKSALQPKTTIRKIASPRSSPVQLANRFNGFQARELMPPTPQPGQIPRQQIAMMTGKSGAGLSEKAKQPIAPAPKKVHREQPWNWQVPQDDSAKLQAYLRGKFVTDANIYPYASESFLTKTNNDYTMSGNAEVGATVWGHNASILGASASFYAPSNMSKPLNVKMGISLLGATVYSFNKSFADKWSYTDTLSFPLPAFEVPAFGIDLYVGYVGVVVGIKGSAGFGYGVWMNRTGINGHLDPFVHTTAYAKGGFSAVVAGAEIVAKVTLLNADLHLNAKVGAIHVANWVVFDEIYSDYNWDALSGKLYAEEWFKYPCLKGLCKKSWTQDLFKWEGFSDSGVLIDQKNNLVFSSW